LVASSQVSEYQGIRPSYGAAHLRVWERATGEPIRTLSPTVTRVLAFSPNGRFLASGGKGFSGHLRVGYGAGIDVWETFSGKKVLALAVSPECVAFSSDGKQLATGGQDHCITLWEAPKFEAAVKGKAPSVEELDAWWLALGNTAADACPAIEQMLEAPEQSVALLKERARPIRLSDPDTVNKLVAQLDSENFADRQQAQQTLEKMGEGAEPFLLKVLEGTALNLEARRRVQDVVKKCSKMSSTSRQNYRAVMVLEWIGSPAARDLLRHLADGAPKARLTLEAQAALKRLDLKRLER
jgi:hypothetical protein